MPSVSSQHQYQTLPQSEYERRRQFCKIIESIGKPEQIEIARILRTRGIKYSENRSGIMFDLVMLPQEVFEDLVNVHKFVEQSEVNLVKRP